MTVERYTAAMQPQWDAFVDASKNATFLHRRGYMDYHADRFDDFSLVMRDSAGHIAALLPASRHGAELRSHGGLTYGGLLMSQANAANAVMDMFPMMMDYLRCQGFESLLYKPVPHIYHRLPAEEDLYVLWRCGATLEMRNLSSAFDITQPLTSRRLTRRAPARQQSHGITVESTSYANDFWHIHIDNLRRRYNATPVHTADELQLLRNRFPNNIKFYTARNPEGQLLASAVIFLCAPVAHVQYGAATELGNQCYAKDVVYHHIVNEVIAAGGFRWFDFGTNNEDGGRYLNAALIGHKEQLGGRGIAYDAYRLPL